MEEIHRIYIKFVILGFLNKLMSQEHNKLEHAIIWLQN